MVEAHRLRQLVMLEKMHLRKRKAQRGQRTQEGGALSPDLSGRTKEGEHDWEASRAGRWKQVALAGGRQTMRRDSDLWRHPTVPSHRWTWPSSAASPAQNPWQPYALHLKEHWWKPLQWWGSRGSMPAPSGPGTRSRPWKCDGFLHALVQWGMLSPQHPTPVCQSESAPPPRPRREGDARRSQGRRRRHVTSLRTALG